jgi:ATP-dependent DNA helicase RecG
MQQAELIQLLDELRALPVETEWLEFKEAKNDYDFAKLGKYFSAIANEANLKGRDYGWLIFGVEDKQRAIVGSQYRRDRAKLESLKQEVANHTTGQLTFLEIFELDVAGQRVVMLQIPAAPQGMPIAWQGFYYGRDGESLGALNLDELERIRRQVAKQDWSAAWVADATLDDLSPEALARARELYREKNPHLAEEIAAWDNWTFLRKLKIAQDQQMTRAALILLGKPESATKLPGTNLQISWILQDADALPLDYKHFGLPYLLNSDQASKQIRNLTYRYMPDDTLFPTELPQYDSWVIREALHNCIAHQDYSLGGKINLVEKPNELVFSNLAAFIPGSVEAVIKSDTPPERYRNPMLAHAMVELKMMDTIGSGIKRMFVTQRKRLFPLPDYTIDSASQRVEVRLYGRVLDAQFSRLLKLNADLNLADVMLLDAVQKHQPITEDAIKQLRQKGLIEGRKPNLFLSAKVASATEDKATYTRHRAMDKAYYKELVLRHLENFGEASREDIDRLLRDKLSSALTEEQKSNQIRNLLHEMSNKEQTIENLEQRPKSRWVLKDRRITK